MEHNTTASICRICLRSCGILITRTKSGIKIRGNPDHPLSKGFICFRGAHYHEIWGSDQRLRQPLLKKGDKWQQISYADAVGILVQKLAHAQKEYGAQSIAFLKGEALKHQEISGYMKHLTHAIGSPNYLSIGSMCQRALAMGNQLTLGGIPKLDHNRAKVAILWGRNLAVSSVHMFTELKKSLKKGMKLIVIDPSRTKTAMAADIHLRITPGSDGFLALAFLKSAMETHGLYPDASGETGWKELRDHIHGLSHGDLLKRTGITQSEFSQAAAMMFNNRPCWNQAGLGLELQPNGVQTIRAVACLQSLVDPGQFPSPTAFAMNPLPNQESYPERGNPIGHGENPLFVNQGGEGQAMHLARAIMESEPYSIRTMVIAGSNPLLTFPGAATQKQAFAALDFLAVCDMFMTPTAKQADLILPGADFLDSMEIHDYGRVGKPYLGLVRPLKDKGPGWPVWKWMFKLAQGLDLGSFFPWKTNEQALEYRLANTPVQLEDLKNNRASVVPYAPDDRHKIGSDISPKVHYYSEAAAMAADAGALTAKSFELPFHTDSSFPFWLSTGDRVVPYQHSQFRVSTSYLKKEPEPIVEIHPQAAETLGIKTNDPVLVTTRFGKVRVAARVTDTVRFDCLRMTHGWEQANVNELTGLDHLDPLSGFPWCRALPANLLRS
ncbi:MAG: molybdopterin-dependent oxidoreductase [Desulfobacterium sp.]|nr:molybdopterin-dependent oxidoreductase [Desulfobacterium sp.]